MKSQLKSETDEILEMLLERMWALPPSDAEKNVKVKDTSIANNRREMDETLVGLLKKMVNCTSESKSRFHGPKIETVAKKITQRKFEPAKKLEIDPNEIIRVRRARAASVKIMSQLIKKIRSGSGDFSLTIVLNGEPFHLTDLRKAHEIEDQALKNLQSATLKIKQL